MKENLQNIVKLKEISTIKDFRFGTFPSISGSGSGSGYTFYRPPLSFSLPKQEKYSLFCTSIIIYFRTLSPCQSCVNCSLSVSLMYNWLTNRRCLLYRYRNRINISLLTKLGPQEGIYNQQGKKKDIMYIFFNVRLKSTLELMLLLYSCTDF
jgi:hypothetical protein